MQFGKSLLASIVSGAMLAAPLAIQAQQDQPGKVEHVLLISVDGLHALDLSNYIGGHPNSALAALSFHGNTYTNASTAVPSDSFPGLAALLTGGSPTTTGFWYDVSYNRALAPPTTTTPYGIAGGANLCPSVRGTQVGFDEEIDRDLTQLNGGGGINPAYLPRDPRQGCQPVYPHSYLRVNTIFEVAKAAGKYTAWSDKHPAYEWANGPSGKGLDDLYTPEINSIPVALPTVAGCNPLPDPAKATASNAWTDSIANIRCYDSLKVNAILNEIDGFNHDRTSAAPVPAIFGFNFQAVSVGQKLKGNGYTDVLGTPSAGLLSELEFVDASLNRIIEQLKKRSLYDSTLIIIVAKHGQSPIDPSKRTGISAAPADILGTAEAFDISDDGSLIWLTNPSLTASAVETLSSPSSQETLGIQEIFAGQSLRNKFNSPVTDPRTPDIILKTNTGVIFTGGSKLSEHGGFNEDDIHSALLVSFPGLKPQTIKTPVLNQQVAPTILKALGLNPGALQAVQQEHITVLPFLF